MKGTELITEPPRPIIIGVTLLAIHIADKADNAGTIVHFFKERNLRNVGPGTNHELLQNYLGLVHRCCNYCILCKFD